MEYTCSTRSAVTLLLLGLSATQGYGSLSEPYTFEDTIASRCGPAEACYPSSARIDELDTSMSGHVIRKSDADYRRFNLMYNKYVYAPTHMIAIVKSKEDIQKAVLFVREFNLHVTIKSTGHDYAGRSTWTDSFVIHLGRMNNIEVMPDTTSRSQYGEVKVETGTTTGEIYKTLDGYDRVAQLGHILVVGPGGYTLGGGHGPVSRSLGYAVDNVLEMQVVLADGSIATCTETQTVIDHMNGTQETRDDGHLLWALRGGGGGTFGVTVYIVFKMHPAPSQMVTFSGTFPLEVENHPEVYVEVMTALKNFILNSPDHWGGYWILNPWPHKYVSRLILYLNKFGPWDGNEEAELADFLKMEKKYTLLDLKLENRTSFWEYQKGAKMPDSVYTYLVGSLLDRKHTSENLLSFFREELITGMRNYWPFGCTSILVGGKTMEPAVDATPLAPGFRRAVSVVTCGADLGQGNQTTLIAAAKRFDEKLRSMGQGMYLNEASMDSVHWREDFWGKENYKKLVQIKKRYDPDNFFTCHHCVNSDTSGSVQTNAYWVSIVLLVVALFAV